MHFRSLILNLITIVLLSACTDIKDQATDLTLVPETGIKQILKIDQAGDIYFSHLGYSGGVLPDGNMVFPEREGGMLVKIDREGNLISNPLLF